MQKGMDYPEGKRLIVELCAHNHKGSFEAYKDITICYPGYKGKNDYRLELEGKRTPPSYAYICQTLYTDIRQNGITFDALNEMLLRTFRSGTKEPEAAKYLCDLQHLIFWITLQEEINYPSPPYAGIRMAFCRFYEAIYCAEHPHAEFTIDEVIKRCNCRGKPHLYEIAGASDYYHY